MSTLLPEFLSVAAPLAILTYREQGGPSDRDRERAREAYTAEIGAHGDTLLFGGKRGDAGRLAAIVADALAVLAFEVGGVKAFGQHFQAVSQ